MIRMCHCAPHSEASAVNSCVQLWPAVCMSCSPIVAVGVQSSCGPADTHAPLLRVALNAGMHAMTFSAEIVLKMALLTLPVLRLQGMSLLMHLHPVLQMQMAVKTKGQRDDITVIVIDALPSEDMRLPPALQQKKSNSTMVAR